MRGSVAAGEPIELDFTTGGKLSPDLLRRLDAVAEREVAAFNRLIAELCRGRERDIDWWVSRPASRNVHLSALFRQCMQLALVRTLLAEGHRLRIRVDEPAFAVVLRRGGDGKIEALARKALAFRLRRLMTHARNLASSVFHSVSALVAARLTRHLARTANPGPIVLIDCYVTRESLIGGFRDRYFPGVMQTLGAGERQRVRYLPIFYRVRRYLRTLRALRRDAANFLVREDYLALADYRFAFGHWWRLRHLLGRDACFAGFEIGPLVDADLRGGRFAQSTVLALLAYRFLQAAPRRGLAIERILNWYEGRDIDHATAAAVAWHALDFPIVAFRPPASRFYLSVTPEPHEAEAGVVPKTVAVVGRAALREIAAKLPSLDVVAAPGLRYTNLAEVVRRPRREECPVLVMLPLRPDLLPGIRDLVEPEFPVADAALRFCVKRHPEMPRQEAERLFGTPLPPGFSFVEGDFQDWLARVEIVAGVGTTALTEALGAGIAVICLGCGNEPTETPIPAWVDARLWRVCYSRMQFGAAVRQLSAEEPAAQDLAQLREDLFSPGPPARLRALLGFDCRP